MSSPIYLTSLCLFFGTALLIFGMKYASAALAARARATNDAAYHGLAERAVAAQTEAQAALVELRADLGKVSASLAAVEMILKQVE